MVGWLTNILVLCCGASSETPIALSALSPATSSSPTYLTRQSASSRRAPAMTIDDDDDDGDDDTDEDKALRVAPIASHLFLVDSHPLAPPAFNRWSPSPRTYPGARLLRALLQNLII
jgi:hypothetical protein